MTDGPENLIMFESIGSAVERWAVRAGEVRLARIERSLVRVHVLWLAASSLSATAVLGLVLWFGGHVGTAVLSTVALFSNAACALWYLPDPDRQRGLLGGVAARLLGSRTRDEVWAPAVDEDLAELARRGAARGWLVRVRFAGLTLLRMAQAAAAVVTDMLRRVFGLR